MIYGILILIYAIVVMAILLDINPIHLTKHRRVIYMIAMPAIILVSIILMRYFTTRYAALYPLLVHLPIVLILSVISNRGLIKVFFVLLTTIFLSYPPSMVHAVAASTLELTPMWAMCATLLTCVVTAFLVWYYMRPDFIYVMEQLDTKETFKFCAVPFGYNLLAYLIGQYDYKTTVTLLRIILFLSTLGVYSLLLSNFRRTRELQCLQDEKTIMISQMNVAKEQLSALRHTQEQASIYRHDLRHHFTLLQGYLAKGEITSAMNYIGQAQSDIEAVTPSFYSINNTVNLLLSSYTAKAKPLGIVFQIEADLPAIIPLPETEICAILSNGLENAVTATAKVEIEDKTIRVLCRIHKGNLLICIQNPYEGEILMKNGIPQSNMEGHGLGIKSIEMLAKKHDGYCSFLLENGIFILKVVLPF